MSDALAALHLVDALDGAAKGVERAVADFRVDQQAAALVQTLEQLARSARRDAAAGIAALGGAEVVAAMRQVDAAAESSGAPPS